MEDQPNQFSGRVAVVGAGPVGLTSALALKARGLSPIVVEADPEDKPRRGSRALFIHNQPIAELEKAGNCRTVIVTDVIRAVLQSGCKSGYQAGEASACGDFRHSETILHQSGRICLSAQPRDIIRNGNDSFRAQLGKAFVGQ